jgi:hypothetical protein
MRRKTFFACLILLLCAYGAFAQSKSHRCEVSVVDFGTDTGSDLGAFVTVVRDDEGITKSFPLLRTKLVVTATVLYTKEDSYSKSTEPDEIVLALAVSRKALRDAGDALNNAVAIVPLKSFESAQVQMNVRGRSQFMVITMECKKSNQP